MTNTPAPPALRCSRTKRAYAGETPRPALSVTSPAAVVAAAFMEFVRPCRSTCCHPDEPPSFSYCCRQPTTIPRPFSATTNFSISRMHSTIMPRCFAQPNDPPGRVNTAVIHATYRERCRNVSPPCRLHPHLLSPRSPAAVLMMLLLPRSAHGHAVRLKIPHPLRTARVPTIILPSRGFGGCTLKTTSSPRHHLRDLPSLQARPPPVIRPCPPAMRTCTSRVFSHHTLRIALRCNCRCNGPQPCVGNISSL